MLEEAALVDQGESPPNVDDHRNEQLCLVHVKTVTTMLIVSGEVITMIAVKRKCSFCCCAV